MIKIAEELKINLGFVQKDGIEILALPAFYLVIEPELLPKDIISEMKYMADKNGIPVILFTSNLPTGLPKKLREYNIIKTPKVIDETFLRKSITKHFKKTISYYKKNMPKVYERLTKATNR